MKQKSKIAILVAGLAIIGSLTLIGSGESPQPSREQLQEQAKTVLGIEGMTCQSCAFSLEQRLEALPSVKSALISFQEKKAYIIENPSTSQQENKAAIETAVKEAGFSLVPID